jgi:adenine-specific DNA-methyltransferase
LIKYLGSKRTIVPAILNIIDALPDVSTVVDLFSGTSRVGHALKRAGKRVLANDHNAYAAALARCYVQADREDLAQRARERIAELNGLAGYRGYFTRTFCEESRFFQPKNGQRVDAMRDQIAAWELDQELEAVLLTALMEAADRVDSTTGVQMAYLKSWAPRAHNDIHLELPDILPRAAAGKGAAYQMDAVEAARVLSGDLAYIDPPYNQHKYLGNYHVWETLVLWDAPEHYGVACKRLDCRTRSSPFNSRKTCLDALASIVCIMDCPNLLVSSSNEGYVDRSDLEELLGSRGHVSVAEMDYKRYVGAQIGIHDPSGEKVGRVSHLRNKEMLFLVTPRPLDPDLQQLTSQDAGRLPVL